METITITRAERGLKDSLGRELVHVSGSQVDELYGQTILYVIPGDASFTNDKEFKEIAEIHNPAMEDYDFNVWCIDYGLDVHNLRFYALASDVYDF